jgi:hypothetical protein
MQDYVVRKNIERFEKLIEAERDPEKAKLLQILLAQEKAKSSCPPDIAS